MGHLYSKKTNILAIVRYYRVGITCTKKKMSFIDYLFIP